MISALRKIEGRGELPGANSAVMEMCIDNPRDGFSNVFDTHPSVDARVAALVKFAGGHDPGPLALAAPDEPARSKAIRQRAGLGAASRPLRQAGLLPAGLGRCRAGRRQSGPLGSRRN